MSAICYLCKENVADRKCENCDRSICEECATTGCSISCVLAAHPQPSASLQEAVERAWFTAKNRFVEAVGDVNDLCVDDILAAAPKEVKDD